MVDLCSCFAVQGCGWTAPLSLATLFSILGALITLMIVLRILTERREAAATLAWLLAVILLPYVGALLYLLLAGKVSRHRIRRRGRAIAQIGGGRQQVEQYLEAHRDSTFAEVHPDQQGIMRVAEELGAGHATLGNQITFLAEGEKTFDAIEADIAKARHHVNLEYYIFRPDETGIRLLQLLAEQARKGVQVRLLYDAVGSSKLKGRHLAELRRAGGRAESFLPLFSLRRPFSVNFRTHRKIIVIDDQIGFVGGRNVGNEYRSGRSDWGVWHDAHLRLEGPAVHRLQEVFAEDWMFAAEEDVTTLAEYFTPFERPGKTRVQVLDSGPDGEPEIIHRILFQAIVSARSSIDIVTPYFVPDTAIVVALQNAALHGVRVRLLVPKKNDSLIVGWAARSYYPEMLQAGVQVHLFTPGMHHAKLAVVDNRWAYVGTANMDIRSFRLNFEVGVALYDPDIARRITTYFETELRRAELLSDRQPSRVEALTHGLGRALSLIL
jgi:cardiolipin synthase